MMDESDCMHRHDRFGESNHAIGPTGVIQQVATVNNNKGVRVAGSLFRVSTKLMFHLY